jgi:hypothetical protein
MRRASWSQWGNLRQATSVAFFCLLYAKELPPGTPVSLLGASESCLVWGAAAKQAAACQPAEGI